MTNEEKQALIEACKNSIARIEKQLPRWEESIYTRPYLESELARQKIALAALTAQPVKLPAVRNRFGPLGSVYVDEVITAIRAAGYEVQE